MRVFFRIKLMGGAGCAVGDMKKSGWGVSWAVSELSVSTPIRGRLQPRTRGGRFHGEIIDRCNNSESQG